MLLLLVACIPELTSPIVEQCFDPAVGNGWPYADPPGALEAEGFGKDQVIPDACLPDQAGADVSIWQFHSRVFVLDVSTIWCEPCQTLAESLQEMADEFGPEGFSYLTLLPQDLEGEVPDEAELLGWAEEFGIAEPVLADDVGYTTKIVTDNAFPKVLVVDRDLRIVGRVNPATDEEIRNVVAGAM